MIAVHIFREIVNEFLDDCIVSVLNILLILIIDIFRRNLMESINPFMILLFDNIMLKGK